MYTKSISKCIINISIEDKIIKCKDENLGNNISPLWRSNFQWVGHIDRRICLNYGREAWKYHSHQISTLRRGCGDFSVLPLWIRFPFFLSFICLTCIMNVLYKKNYIHFCIFLPQSCIFLTYLLLYNMSFENLMVNKTSIYLT